MLGCRVAVIGGGLTGLSACYHLEKLGVAEIHLFESSSRLGGKIQTVSSNGRCVECGPDSIFTRYPEVLEFISELGLSDEVIEPSTKGYSIWLDGALREIPSGITRLGSIDSESLDKFKFLSPESKAAVRAEKAVPAVDSGADESIRSFFTRRFGAEYTAKIAEPLFAGTHGGRADCLSMRALFPGYLDLERQFGSLANASEAGQTASLAKFISFKRGTQTLISRLEESLVRTRVLKQKVSALATNEDEVLVDGERFNAAILAVPSHFAAHILRAVSPGICSELSGIQAASSTIVTLGFDSNPDFDRAFGTGFLVPEYLNLQITGATFSSKKWRGRSPEGTDLVRVFLKGNPEHAETLAQSLFEQITGISFSPNYSRVDPWDRGLPQYVLGHSELIASLRSALSSYGNLYLAGQSYSGAGIPDCIRQGREAAQGVLSKFNS